MSPVPVQDGEKPQCSGWGGETTVWGCTMPRQTVLQALHGPFLLMARASCGLLLGGESEAP